MILEDIGQGSCWISKKVIQYTCRQSSKGIIGRSKYGERSCTRKSTYKPCSSNGCLKGGVDRTLDNNIHHCCRNVHRGNQNCVDDMYNTVLSFNVGHSYFCIVDENTACIDRYGHVLAKQCH